MAKILKMWKQGYQWRNNVKLKDLRVNIKSWLGRALIWIQEATYLKSKKQLKTRSSCRMQSNELRRVKKMISFQNLFKRRKRKDPSLQNNSKTPWMLWSRNIWTILLLLRSWRNTKNSRNSRAMNFKINLYQKSCPK